MAIERTLSIIKPDAVRRNLIGKIFSRFEENGFKIVGARMLTLTKEQAQKFYEVHKERAMFNDLVEFMTSGPIVVSVLEKENAVADYRELIGATDPAEAKEGTIRREFAESKPHNCVHGSDSLENAKNEVAFFFPSMMVF